MLIPIFSFPVISKNFFLALFDLFTISFSYYLSFLLVFKSFGGIEKELFIQTLPFVLITKIAIFYISGIYKGTWTYSSIEDVLLIGKSVLLSSLGSLFVLLIISVINSFGGILFFLVDFYLLISFAVGLRISFRVLDSLYKRNSNNNGRKILIYGAGHKGSTVLKEIKHNDAYLYSPVGFIDDDINKKGKILHSFPILGSIDEIEKIAEKNDIAEIIVSTGKIGRDKIYKLTSFCEQEGILMKQFEFRFYEFP